MRRIIGGLLLRGPRVDVVLLSISWSRAAMWPLAGGDVLGKATDIKSHAT